MKRYRVLDPHAKKIGGVPLNADGSVTLTDRQAKYPLDQRQIVELPKEIPPAPPVPLSAPELEAEAEASPKRGSRSRRG